MNYEPLFQSEELKSVYEQSKEALRKAQNRAVYDPSQDIQEFEKLLGTLSIPDNYAFLNNEGVRCDDNKIPTIGMSCTIVREKLIWSSTSKKLIYKLYEADGDLDPDYAEFLGKPYSHEEFQQVTNCPLIEAKLEVQLSISQQLPRFIEILTKK
jgi:hypothetical protein